MTKREKTNLLTKRKKPTDKERRKNLLTKREKH